MVMQPSKRLIPDARGTIPDPRGGVRGAILEKRCAEQLPIHYTSIG